MEMQLTVVNITQAQRGAVQFAELDAEKKPVKDSTVVVIQFADPRQAAQFVHGGKYNISFDLVTE